MSASPDSFKKVPVTSYSKRADGFFDISQCFNEEQCSSDGAQCSKCEICKKQIAFRISASNIPEKAYVDIYPMSKDSKYFFIPKPFATEAAVKDLLGMTIKGCVSVSPCTDAFKDVCCASTSTEDVNKTKTNIPWWVWLIVGVVGFLLILLLVLVFYMVFKKSHSVAAAPQVVPAAANSSGPVVS